MLFTTRCVTSATVSNATGNMPPSTVAQSAVSSTTVNIAGPLSTLFLPSVSTAHSAKTWATTRGQCHLLGISFEQPHVQLV